MIKNGGDKSPLFFNERITARYNRPNKNSSYVFKANRSIKNKDILMCLDVVAREYGEEVVDKIEYFICCFNSSFRFEYK